MAQAGSGALRTEPPRLDLFPPLLLTTGGTRRQRPSNIARSMALLQTPETRAPKKLGRGIVGGEGGGH